MAVVEGLLALAAAVVLAWLVLVLVVVLHRPSRELVVPALRLIPDLVRLVRSLLADRQTPRRVNVALGGLLVYLISPIDLIPDFLPLIGSVDDLVVTTLVLRWAGRRIGVDGLRAHWAGSETGFAVLLRLLDLAR